MEFTAPQAENLNFEKVWLMFLETNQKFQETDKIFKEMEKILNNHPFYFRRSQIISSKPEILGFRILFSGEKPDCFVLSSYCKQFVIGTEPDNCDIGC